MEEYTGLKQIEIPKSFEGEQWKIIGEDSQILEVLLSPGKKLFTEPGTMCYVSDRMSSSMETGGLCSAWRRSCFGGEKFMFLTYENKKKQTLPIGITPNFPAKIIPINLQEHSNIRIKSGAFLASIGDDVEFHVATATGMAGCFGGQGFILNELRGSSTIFLNAGGTIVRKDLKPKESIVVDTYSVVAFEKTVKYSVQKSGGISVICCGGEGVFSTKFTGPGSVWIQSLSFEKFSSRINEEIRKRIDVRNVKNTMT